MKPYFHCCISHFLQLIFGLQLPSISESACTSCFGCKALHTVDLWYCHIDCEIKFCKNLSCINDFTLTYLLEATNFGTLWPSGVALQTCGMAGRLSAQANHLPSMQRLRLRRPSGWHTLKSVLRICGLNVSWWSVCLCHWMASTVNCFRTFLPIIRYPGGYYILVNHWFFVCCYVLLIVWLIVWMIENSRSHDLY